MRTVTYKSVQEKANLLFAGKVGANTDDTAALNRYINSRYREFWERFFWPEWTVVERRLFRPQYNGASTYAISAEVFYWPTEGYYQSLRAQPLTLDTLTRSGTTATATILAGHNLSTGDRPIITISGVTPTDFNGTWSATITSATTFTYTLPADPGADGSGTMLAGINPADASDQVVEEYWAVSQGRYSASDWAATATYAVGQQVFQRLDGNFYQCIAAHSNQQPPNTTYWGVLTAFERDIDLDSGATSNQGASATRIGEVKTVWDEHPWRVEDARTQAFQQTYDGLLVRGAEPVVWLEFRLRPVDFTGANWATGTSYIVGDQVYYTTGGDYYVCIQATTSALPTDASFWTKLDFPYVLKDAVAQAAFADLLKSSGKTSKWADELRESFRILQREFDKLERQQGQTTNLNVQTR